MQDRERNPREELGFSVGTRLVLRCFVPDR